MSGEMPDFFARYKVADMLDVWNKERTGVQVHTILDFGGGIGTSAPHLNFFFPNAEIVLADVSERSLAIAATRGIQRLRLLVFDGQTLPIPDKTFDIALAACVFHHIPMQQHVQLLGEIRRVLKDDGLLLVFEHNPWNPLTRHAVSTCPFDENAVLISAPTMRKRMLNAGYRQVTLSFRIFFPAALRRLRTLEPALASIPLGAQYRSVGRA